MPLLLKNEFSYADILKAYMDCRKRKRGKRTCIAYEVDFERNLIELLDEINNGDYCIGRSRAFTVLRPKPREIWAAQFRDRIVHHLIYNEIGSYFEERFIEDSFSCIKGRGTLAAAKRLEKFCRQATCGWSNHAWYLQVDISNFFVSIDRQKLWEIISETVGEKSLTSRIIKQIIFHDPTENPIIKQGSDFSKIPPHKSLWLCRKGKGLAIGNLTSQFMSNVYLDAADKFAKHELRARWYVRYVDDIVFLSTDRQQLYQWHRKFEDWLLQNRALALHADKVRISPIAQGINFVGAIIRPYRVYPRRSTVHSANIALANIVRAPTCKANFDTLQSYIGMMRHMKTYNLRTRLCTSAQAPLTIGHDQDMTKIIKLYQ